MVQEDVKLDLKGIGIHIPPEFPLSLEEKLKYSFPGWEIYEKNNSVTSIRTKEKNISVTSSSREIKSHCVGDYGKNFESIKTVGEVIKRIGEFSKREGIERKLAESDCKVEITYYALPIHLTDFKSNINCLVYPESNVTKLWYANKFYNFLDRYKYDFSRRFIF